MTRPLYVWLPGLTAFVLFNACGGVSDPGLFGTNGGASAAGNANQGGESAQGGRATDSEAGNSGVAEAGANDGGSSAAGSHSAGTGGGSHSGGSGGTAAGGAVGHGGASGNAGTGTSGSAGSAGTGGDPTCNELFTQAGQQLEAARACNIAQNVTQCTGKVTSPCNCEVPVEREDSAETKAYLATRKQLDKKKCALICPALACLPVTHAQCSAPTSGDIGVCTTSSAVAN